MRSTWFDGLQTKADMNSLVIGEIESIMGDLSTNADKKVIQVARALDCLNKAWDAKKDSSPQGAPKVNSQLDYNTEIQIALVTACESCDCFGCSHWSRCHLLLPTTQICCEKECIGRSSFVGCVYTDKEKREPLEEKWTLEEIMRNEG